MYNCPVRSINRRKIIMASIRKKRKAFVEQADCVACGCCVKVCPLEAIRIISGNMARPDLLFCSFAYLTDKGHKGIL